jgi:hypothetical protein
MYQLVSDNDEHWYVIPTEHDREWADFLDIDSDDERSWTVPEWACPVGGSPSLVIFDSYRLD